MFSDKISTLIRNATNILNIFETFQEGNVVFSSPGEHVLEITTRSEPTEVWLTIINEGSMAVCQGDVNKLSYNITPTGFVLYAEINTDFCQVGYYVEF
jgi:hypothetical protein